MEITMMGYIGIEKGVKYWVVGFRVSGFRVLWL